MAKKNKRVNYHELRKRFRDNSTCKLCGIPITPDITKSEYCLNCSMKHSELIRRKKKEEREALKTMNPTRRWR